MGLWPIRDLLRTVLDLSKRGERFMSLEWGNRKLSLNQLHECKSRTRWVLFYIDHGDGANYHPLLLLETVAAVAYLNLAIVKREWRNFIYSLFRFNSSTHCKSKEDALDFLRKSEIEHTVRFSVWSSPKGFGDSGKDNYLTKLKNVFRKNFKCQ